MTEHNAESCLATLESFVKKIREGDVVKFFFVGIESGGQVHEVGVADIHLLGALEICVTSLRNRLVHDRDKINSKDD